MATITSLFAFLLCLILTQAQPTVRTINVAGTGTVSTPPDLATVNTGVVTAAETAEEALDENNKAVNNVINTLKSRGIESKDIQTISFNVNPQFERKPRGERGDIIGYRVSNDLNVKIRDLDILGEVLDALVNAGSNRISSINFGIANPEPLSNQARRNAVADAMSRARLYANAAGVKLGKIISISENPIAQPSPEGRFARAAGSGVPIATGELDVSATVFILFQIRG